MQVGGGGCGKGQGYNDIFELHVNNIMYDFKNILNAKQELNNICSCMMNIDR